MTPKRFFDKVAELRRLQLEFEKTNSMSILTKSKLVAAEIDAEIERVNKKMSETSPKEGTLEFT